MPNQVDDFNKAHTYDDTDMDRGAKHHTLGKGMTQAAPGNHNHDGDYQPSGQYYTKIEADGRFEPLDSAYTKAEADSRFEPAGDYATNTSLNAHTGDSTIHHTLGFTHTDAAYGDHTHVLDDIGGVNVAAPADGAILKFNASTGNWEDVATEAVHIVGTTGEPAFQNGWHNNSAGDIQVGFYKDALGLVHVQGVVTGGSPANTSGGTGVVFTLPVGYRPSGTLNFATAANVGCIVTRIFAGGEVCVTTVGGASGAGWNSIAGTAFAPA